MKELRKVRWFKDSGMKNVVRKYGCLILMFCAAFLTGLTTGAVPVAAARTVQITYSGQTVDSFNGVEAKYIPGTGNSNSGTYSCAGYVKAYYKAIYGVDVYNLLTGKTPQASGHSFSRITSGFQAGDIVYHTNSAGSGQFSLKVYSESNPDVARTFSNPRDRICHFVEYVYYGTEKHRIYI